MKERSESRPSCSRQSPRLGAPVFRRPERHLIMASRWQCQLQLRNGSSYIKRSGQLWKLGLFFVCPLMALFLIVGAFRVFPTHDQVAAIMILCGVLLGVVGLVWASTITCQQCKTRLFWLALRSQRQSNWMAWLLSFERCPKCDSKPA